MITEFDRIVVIDFETTGTSRDKRAVEVAWFELNKNLEIIDEQASLINPMIPIPWEVIAIHGITDDMVKDSPTLDEFIVDIHQDTFANSSVCVVAHNLPFDLPLFEKYCGNVVELCTLKLARNIYPELNNHKLSTISERFGFVHEEAHRARSDALQVVHFLNLVKETHGLNIFQMIDKTKPKSGKSKIGNTDKSNLGASNNGLNDAPTSNEPPDSDLNSAEKVSGSLTYDFTEWKATSGVMVLKRLISQGIKFTWSDRKMTVSETCEDSVDAIISEVQESWTEKTSEEEIKYSPEIVEYVFNGTPISELAALVNELNRNAITHEWLGHRLLVSSDFELVVDEIIAEQSLNPDFAVNSLEEFENDDSDKYKDERNWKTTITFPYFTIPMLISLENELVVEEITHFWDEQTLHMSADDGELMLAIVDENREKDKEYLRKRILE